MMTARSIAVSAGVALVAVLPVSGAPPGRPLEAPEFSLDLASPSLGPFGAGDILERGILRPRVVLPANQLHLLSPDDELDAVSGPHAGIGDDDPLLLIFSVDRATIGASAPGVPFVLRGLPYNVFDQAERGHAASDVFVSPETFTLSGPARPLEDATRNNLLALNGFNEGGSDLSLEPPTHASTVLDDGVPIDRVDALARLPRNAAGYVRSMFYSLSSSSPSLPSMGTSGADIFVAFADWAGACCLGDECAIVTLDECIAMGGDWQGTSSGCSRCLPAVGACCVQGACFEAISRPMCVGPLSGLFFPGTDCESAQCHTIPLGACCMEETSCIDELDAITCALADGVFHEGEGCDAVPCGSMVTGACCIADGCLECSFEVCDAIQGVFRPGVDCAGGPCDPEQSEGENDPPEGEDETSSGCNAPAPCCLPDGVCAVIDVIECAQTGGVPLEGENCGACVTTGACCLAGQTCVLVDVRTCDEQGGDWIGAGTRCETGCRSNPPAPYIRLYATRTHLGLQRNDDIDALAVFDLDGDLVFGGDDRVLFSLAPGSPSLESLVGASETGAAADVFMARPGMAPVLYAPAALLGLGAESDNIDALEAIVVGSAPTDHAIRGCQD